MVSALNRVDLPALGRPTIPMVSATGGKSRWGRRSTTNPRTAVLLQCGGGHRGVVDRGSPAHPDVRRRNRDQPRRQPDRDRRTVPRPPRGQDGRRRPDLGGGAGGCPSRRGDAEGEGRRPRRPGRDGAAERAAVPGRLLRRGVPGGGRRADEPAAQGARGEVLPRGLGCLDRLRLEGHGRRGGQGGRRGRRRVRRGGSRLRRGAGRLRAAHRGRRPGRRRRRRAALHLGHHGPAQGRPADPPQHDHQRRHECGDPDRDHRGRRGHGLPAPLPRLRPDLRPQRRRAQGLLPDPGPPLRRRQGARGRRARQGDGLRGRPDHVRRDAARPGRRPGRPVEPADLHLGRLGDAGGDHEELRGGLPVPGLRGLRALRDLPRRLLQPARPGAQARLDRDRGARLRDEDRRRRAQRGRAGRGRRDRHQGRERHEGLLGPRGGHPRRDRRRLVPHRRHGEEGRGRLLLHRRPQEGPHHPRRLQRLPARGRGGALRARGGRRGGRDRHPRRQPGRGGRRGGRAQGRQGRRRRGAPGLRQGPARGVQVPRAVWIVEELPKGPTGKILRREVSAPEKDAEKEPTA